jgi:hypothetical protein
MGDAFARGHMPKARASANSQAKVAVNTILDELTGSRIFPAKHSNTCRSLIAPDEGVNVTSRKVVWLFSE